MSIAFHNATVLTPTEMNEGAAVVVSDEGKIEYVGAMKNVPRHDGRSLDMSGKILAPGLIDIHRHGGFGIAFGMGENISKAIATGRAAL